MKRIKAKIWCLLLLLMVIHQGVGKTQDRAFRLGFQTGPMVSWINSNDNLIIKNGGNLGLKLGTTADIFFSESYSLSLGCHLGFHQGGEFQYEIGGNFLPESDLSDPILNSGDKPLPDGVRIRYRLQYLEIPVGLKLRSKEIGYIRYYVEAPIFTFSVLTRGRGDIETSDFSFEKENIYKDLVVPNVFWGLGAGLEYAISQHNSLVAGLYFQSGLFDFTRDKGHRARPNPDVIPAYILEKENSRATVSNLTLRLGIIF